MTEPEVLLFIIKLVLGGILAFLAILVWSKTRDAAWFFLVSGTILAYCGVVYEMLKSFGIITKTFYLLWNIPIIDLCFVVIPSLFFIVGFIIMIAKSKY
ncbi:MAG: hypothetical protein IJA53_07670 [Spirochaetaceae bacterium]|nr:hypothetical protein [Spirochaetaceae bacterium]